MEYLLAWRMALAKNLLRRKEGRIAEVAERVGNSSASTFRVAFTRYIGVPPARYAQGSGLRTRPYHRFVDPSNLGLIHFFNLAVVGKQTIVFALDVGDLRIHAAGHAFGHAFVA